MSGTWEGFSEVFAIFAKYEKGSYETYADYEIINSGPDPKIVSDEDKARLEELGWHPGGETNDSGEGFDGSFWTYV